MATTSRRARLFRRTGDDGADDGADLSEDEHAWWAARTEVGAVPTGRRVEEPAPEASTSHFADYWTAESLFTHGPDPAGATSGPTEPTVDGVEADAVEEAPLEPSDHLMDLDAAHLVLQVAVGSDWEAITKAQRRLAMLYHPDRLIDLSPVAQELGRGRMAEINAAHATLRALHFR